MRKPRDKAAVESGVLLVERWILARLRDATFFSLAALNDAIRVLVAELNSKLFQKREGSRASVFAAEKIVLRALPASAYEYATWKKSKVHLDYHVEIERRYYSVPHALIDKTVDVRLTATGVEIFHRGQRVAVHLRSGIRGSFTTTAEHRPPSSFHTRATVMNNRSSFFRNLAKVDLLMLDDFGLAPLTGQTRRDLMEIFDDRYHKKSTLITSQLPVEQWHAYLGDPTLADAILDRVAHNSCQLNLTGESMRKKKTTKSAATPPN